MHNRYLSQPSPTILPFAYTIATASIVVCHFYSIIFSLRLTLLYITAFHVCDPPLLFSYNWELVGNTTFVCISNPDLVRYNYQQALVVYLVIG